MRADAWRPAQRLRVALTRALSTFIRLAAQVPVRYSGPLTLAVALGAVLLIHQRPQAAAAGASAFSLAAEDTIAVYGARTFATPTGQPANHVEQFTVSFAPSTAYELLIEFGDASGANRPSAATVKLNGDVIATDLDFASNVRTLRRSVEVLTTNVLEVTVAGSPGALVRTTLFAFSDGTMTIFGPGSYDAAANQPRSVSESFSLPVGALPPYRVHVVNGEPDGTLRASSATLRVNGVEVIGSLLKDAFSRTVAQGWGNADVGGAWGTSNSGPFRVDGSSGIIEVSNTGPQIVVGTHLATYGSDVAGLASFSLNRAPDAADRFHTVQVYALRNDRVNFGHNYYRYRVRIFGNGTMDVRVEKSVDNSESFVTSILPRISRSWRARSTGSAGKQWGRARLR